MDPGRATTDVAPGVAFTAPMDSILSQLRQRQDFDPNLIIYIKAFKFLDGCMHKMSSTCFLYLTNSLGISLVVWILLRSARLFLIFSSDCCRFFWLLFGNWVIRDILCVLSFDAQESTWLNPPGRPWARNRLRPALNCVSCDICQPFCQQLPCGIWPDTEV